MFNFLGVEMRLHFIIDGYILVYGGAAAASYRAPTHVPRAYARSDDL